MNKFQGVVPRRSGIFLFVTNYFPYSITIPVLGLVMFMNAEPAVTVTLAFLGIAGISLFWFAYSLDINSKEPTSPHFRGWNKLNKIVYPLSILIKKTPDNFIVVTAMVLANIPVVLGALSYYFHETLAGFEPRFSYELYWLSYLPVVLWISYKRQNKVSELWAIALATSIFLYSIGYLFIPSNDKIVDKLLRLTILMSWFVFIAVIFHYAFRRVAHYRGQSEIARGVTEKLRNSRGYINAFDVIPVLSEKDEYLTEIAGYIGKELMYDRVFILVKDPENNNLIMKGMYGVKQAEWPSEGWSTDSQKSITGWVAKNKKEHLCSDTNKCDLFFNPRQSFPCKSEVAVPIVVDEECVGVIDIESEYVKAFHYSDVRLLWQIANSMAAALSHERSLVIERENAFNILEQATNNLVLAINLDDALERVLVVLREKFSADLAILYKHAVATGAPLPDLIRSGDFFYKNMLGNPISNKSRLLELINKNEDTYIQPFADRDELLIGSNDGLFLDQKSDDKESPYHFVKREGIQSMVYLKLYVGEDIVGSLFLNYRYRKVFSKHEINSLKSFSKVLALSILLKRQLERAQGPLAGAVPLAHSATEAAFESVNRNFEELRESLYVEMDDKKQLTKIDNFKNNLDGLKLQWSNLVITEKNTQKSSMIIDSISQLESRLKKMFPHITFTWNSKEFLHVPSGELGEVAYKVIAEGVSNALVHGGAHFIELGCSYERNTFMIAIRNNGKVISAENMQEINDLISNSVNIHELKKYTGIIPILLDAKRWFGAEAQFQIKDGEYTILNIVFPNLNSLLSNIEDDDED